MAKTVFREHEIILQKAKQLLKWPFPLLWDGLRCFYRSPPASLLSTSFSILTVVSVSSSAVEEMVLHFFFFSFQNTLQQKWKAFQMSARSA